MRVAVYAIGRSRRPVALLEDRPDVELKLVEEPPPELPDGVGVLVFLPDVKRPLAALQRLLWRGVSPEVVLIVPEAALAEVRAAVRVGLFLPLGTVVVSAGKERAVAEALARAVETASSSRRFGQEMRALRDRLRTPSRSMPGPLPDATTFDAQRTLIAVMVRTTPNALIGATPDGRIALWNPAAERLYGRSPEEAIGAGVDALFAPEAAADLEEVKRCWAEGCPIERKESRHVTKAGEVREVEMSALSLRGQGGTPLGGALVVRDITEEKRREALRRRFISVLGHDLRAPLMSFVMGISVLRRALENEPRLLRTLDRMESGARRAPLRPQLRRPHPRGGAAAPL